MYARGVARTGDTARSWITTSMRIEGARVWSICTGTTCRRPPSTWPHPLWARRDRAFWPRFPFALCGLLSIALLLFWMWRDGASSLFWALMSIGLVTNVSMFLYFRQCRYFGLATLLSLAAVYCYLHWDGRRWMLVGLCVFAGLLMLTHYLPYAGLMLGLAADYALFGRRQRRLTSGDWALLVFHRSC